ncbi:MAG: MASE1 domain-containing protein [Sulfuricella sp.]|nr:MASE1 domain-containing protein [Sulfuricella sp.]
MSLPLPTSPTSRWLAKIVALVTAYYAAGRLGLAIPYAGSHITLIWLPTGIAVAALLRWGYPMLPGVWLGAFLVNLTIGSSTPLAAAIAIGNTLGPLATIWLLHHSDFHPAFDRRRDITQFGVAAVLGMSLSASGGVASLYLAEVMPWSALGSAWLTWWGGDAIGVLLAGPLLLALSHETLATIARRRGEFLAWMAVVLAVLWLAFVANTPVDGRTLPMAFLPLPLIAWAAMRFGVFGASSGSLLLAVAGAWGTATGRGTFYLPDQHVGLTLLGAYMVVTLLMGFLMAALNTERRQAEEVLRRERDFAESLIETAQAIVLVLDPAGRIVRFNPYLESISGYSAQDAVGKDWFTLFLPEHRRESTRALFRQAIGNIQTHGNVDSIVTRDGRERLIEWYDKTLRDSAGRIIGLLAVGQDITERKQAEEALRQLNEHLEQRVAEEAAKSRDKDHLLIQQSRLAAMGEMIGNIAHQWRQPINALNLLLVNIEDAYDFGELTKDDLSNKISTGNRLIQQMSTTIDDFRNFFRPDKEKAPFTLSSTLAEIREILGAGLASHCITLEEDLPHEITVTGYANEYAQMLLNLVNNASEAIQTRHIATGRIRVEMREENGMAVARVSDNGGGIPAEVLPKIFDPYFTTKTKGTGIGLYMAKAIIETNMGGSIEVHNSSEGAEFTVTVPLG